MKRNIIILLLLCSTLAAEAKDNPPAQSPAKQQYKECVAVSMFTRQGREINAIAENNRAIEETNLIPEGWSVLGLTTQKEALITTPYLVICR